MANLPAVYNHPFKQDIYDKLDAGVSPHQIDKWLKRISEKEGKDYTISVPTIYKYKKRRRFRTEKNKIKKELDVIHKNKDINLLEKNIKDIDNALSGYDLTKLGQAATRSYRELINAKVRLIKAKNELLKTYDADESDLSQKMTALFIRIRKQEELENIALENKENA